MLEILGKLAAKNCSWMPIGGKPEITWEDVAGSLPHFSQLGKLYIFAKYVDIKIESQLLAEAKALALKKFGTKDESKVKTLAALALDQAINPGHCKSCNGSGQIPSKNGFLTCKSCQGTGRAKELSTRQLAARLRVGGPQVKQIWRARLNELQAEYQMFEIQAEEALKRLKK